MPVIIRVQHEDFDAVTVQRELLAGRTDVGAVAAFTGLVLYGAEEHAGPLASLASSAGSYSDEWFEEVHEFFANSTLLLVLIHVASVLVESLIHREYLVQAMWSRIRFPRTKPRFASPSYPILGTSIGRSPTG